MIPVPANLSLEGSVRMWLATGHTDMRRGFPGLALLVQETLKASDCAATIWMRARIASPEVLMDC